MSYSIPHESPPSSFRIKTTSTTTSTTIITSDHPHTFQVHQNLSNPSLTRRPSLLPSIHLTPLFTLAAYGSIIIAAFSALFGLVLANYGLTAWGDVKERFIGARAFDDEKLKPEKETIRVTPSIVSSNFEYVTREHIPRRPHPNRSSSSFDSRRAEYSSKFTFPRTRYDTSTHELRNIHLATSSDELGRMKHHRSRSSFDRRAESTNPTPRPTLSILIASLFFTLIVVTVRLMVSWWMGQQAQKNPTLAYRDAQRAYEAAQEEEEVVVEEDEAEEEGEGEDEGFRLASTSSYPSSSKKRIKNVDRFSSLSF